MSIALSIIDLATERAEQADANRIVEVQLDIGIFSGIEIAALHSALHIAIRDTMLEEARIKVNMIQPISQCLRCREVFRPEEYSSQCPTCGEPNARMIKGQEMQVKSLLVE